MKSRIWRVRQVRLLCSMLRDGVLILKPSLGNTPDDMVNLLNIHTRRFKNVWLLFDEIDGVDCLWVGMINILCACFGGGQRECIIKNSEKIIYCLFVRLFVFWWGVLNVGVFMNCVVYGGWVYSWPVFGVYLCSGMDHYEQSIRNYRPIAVVLSMISALVARVAATGFSLISIISFFLFQETALGNGVF